MLPVISAPVYQLKLVANNKVVKYRPFTVKEERALMLALKSEDSDQIKNTVIHIIESCILTPNVKVSELAIFDLEKLFLEIRGKSVGEGIDLMVSCTDEVDVEEPTKVPVRILIDDIKVYTPPEHTNIIKLDDEYSLIMKYPSLDMFLDQNFVTGEMDYDTFQLIEKCIDQIVHGKEIYKVAEHSESELTDFVNSLSPGHITKIQEFFDTMPVLKYELNVTNPNTGKVTEVVLEGMGSFFG